MSAQPQYTPDQIKQAARNAYSKGDYAGAKRLDGLYQRSVQQQPQAQAQPQANDGAFAGFGDAFIRGIDQPLENMGVTAEALGYQGVADNLKGAVDERPGQSASAQFMNADQDGSFAWRYLPKAGVEQAGQFAGSILSRLGGMGLGGLAGSIIPGAGTAGGAMVGGLTGPVVFEAAQQLGPIALERAKNNGRKVPNAEDWKYATGTSAGMGALNTIAPGLSGKLKRMLVEGATEGTQSVVEQVGSTVNTKKGLEVDPRQALAEGIIGGTSAGMVDTSVGTVKAAANLVTGGSAKSDMTEEESKAAASYAQRLIKKAEANDYDLKDIDTSSDKGARQAVDSTHVDMTEELRQLFNDLKPILDIKDTDSLDAVAEKVLAKVAYRKARNKTKNTVEQEDFAAVESLAGNTQEGQRALNIMRELNQMTSIHNGGYKGGVSQYTDQLAPLGLGGEGYDRGKAISERLLRPLVSAQAFASTGGSSLLGQLGAMGTGRAIDKVTGRRSTVDRFARKYGSQPGQPAATGPSVRESNIEEIQEEERLAVEEAARQEQMAAENRDANLQRVQQGAPPQFGSPEDIMRDGTGLDRAEIAQVIRILKSNPNTLPGVRRAIDAYEQGIAVGGEMDFSLIRDINAFVDANPNYVQRNRQPNVQRAAATAQAGAQQNLTQRDQNYQRGIENNLAFVKQLQDQLNDDKSVRPIEKAKLLDTLNSMQFDLGADPIAALKAHADRLYDGGVSEDAMQKYFVPYMERVQQQQQAAQRKKLADRSDTETIVSTQAAMDDARIVPVPFNNQGMQNAFGVNSPTEGGNYIDLDSREDLTGNTYAVGSVKIIDGKPLLETNDAPAAPATKDSGNKVKVNLFKKKAGWSWVDYDGPDTIVSTEQGGKHHYSLNTDFQTPVTLQTYPKQPSEPRLRPTSQGKVVLGNKIGSISVRGKLHPVYDQVTIQDKRADRQQFNDDRSPQLVGETVEQRKQRAEAQGYDTKRTMYHGTPKGAGLDAFKYEFTGKGTDAFGVGFYLTSSPSQASGYAGQQMQGDSNAVIPAYTKSANLLKVDGRKVANLGDVLTLDSDQTRKILERAEPLNRGVDDEDMNPLGDRYESFWNDGPQDWMFDQLAEDQAGRDPHELMDFFDGDMEGYLTALSEVTGYDGIELQFEDGFTNQVHWKPSNIRSVNAQFDSAKTDSANLSDSRSPSVPALTQVSSPNIISLVDGTETPPKMTVKAEVGNFLQTRALEKLGGIQRDINDPADRSAIADDLVSEAIYEMESKDSAVEWYDSTIESMLEMLSLKYPEIANDPNAKTPMLVSLAIMSQNLDVPTNLKMAEKAYEYFRENGRFEIHGTGKSLAVMEQNFDKANRLLDKLGSMEAFTEFLQMELPVKDMNTALQGMLGDDGKVGGENMDTVVYGSAIFGPKVGNGFYTNLRGDFTPVTMDMWFMRTVGRLKGDLMEFDEAKFQKQLNRLKTALGRKRISREKLIEEAMRLRKVHEKDYKDNKKLYKAKIKEKSEATLAAETIVKSLTATTDSPKSGGERNVLRELVKEAVAKFNEKTGLDIQPAAFQALIWYPEQDLYKSLGVQLKHVRQDYANSAKQLLIQEGYNEQELNSAIDRVRSRREQGSGQVRQGPGQVDQQAAGQADRRPGSPVPQGQGPILTQDERDIDYTDVTKFLPPTVNKVKDQLPEAQAIVDGVIHIGKKGTKFEKGIGTEEDLLTIADHLDIAVKIYDDAEKYYEESGDLEKNTHGRHRGGPRSSEIWVQGKELLGELPAFITLTHEVSHGMENRPEDADADDELYENIHAHPGATKTDKSTYYKGSLRHKIAEAVYAGSWYQGIRHNTDKKFYRNAVIKSQFTKDITYSDAAKIKNEIEKIQRMAASIPSRPELGSKNLRATFDSEVLRLLKGGDQNKEVTQEAVDWAKTAYKKQVNSALRPYRRYIREDAEFAVDPVILYLMDPKTMKRVAPVTSKYIRDHFNKSTLPVKFHANPMAVILSILMAGALMKGEEEEEEKMAPGVLSPQPALLSA